MRYEFVVLYSPYPLQGAPNSLISIAETGRVMARYGVAYDTMQSFSGIKPGLSMSDVVCWIIKIRCYSNTGNIALLIDYLSSHRLFYLPCKPKPNIIAF